MKERNIAVCILLTVITCGIYGIYWFIVMTDEVVTANGGKEYSTSGGMAFLFTLLTCGIYEIYWNYQMGKALYSAQKDKNLEASDNSILYLILSIFGLSIVSYALIQNDLNKLNK